MPDKKKKLDINGGRGRKLNPRAECDGFVLSGIIFLLRPRESEAGRTGSHGSVASFPTRCTVQDSECLPFSLLTVGSVQDASSRISVRAADPPIHNESNYPRGSV